MKKLSLFAVAALMLLGVVSCSKYETVKGDPMKVKIYTLDNGLKVYMSVNKEQPRLQTYIAVRNGGKNDPSDNTGLALSGAYHVQRLGEFRHIRLRCRETSA